MTNCIFCQIVAGEIPSYKIYEDNEILAFLDILPVNPGHVLVISKKHFDDFLTTPDAIHCQIIKVAKKIGKKIVESGLGEGFNIGVNTGSVAGQVVNHFHLHLMPRKKGDGYKLWRGKKYLEGEAKKIVKIIEIK
ncbi:MAG: Hit-like protein involved in cell-cycle regulation [Candidatus Berkelbacteria bacterium Athens1014_28]|uniref:Hit-like protein involved in cell-cycle regulation n=1 Tax=Candidatus Berkelbacteria bacterium Athens1014_28 TaxID=2017145 RepID=A0A554LLN4_9BACT|nr:MAG: Hit-like protein involved in cell-cycle regulation [Candidatus Berkelbacteria bacterium Athens1014_28]